MLVYFVILTALRAILLPPTAPAASSLLLVSDYTFRTTYAYSPVPLLPTPTPLITLAMPAIQAVSFAQDQPSTNARPAET